MNFDCKAFRNKATFLKKIHFSIFFSFYLICTTSNAYATNLNEEFFSSTKVENLTSRSTPIIIVDSLEYGIHTYGRNGIPFIVKQCGGFATQGIMEKLSIDEREIWGYNKDRHLEPKPLCLAIKEWLNDELTLNFLDVRLSVCEVPVYIENLLLDSPIDGDAEEQMLVLSSKGTYTPLHVDWAIGDGYMYLISGTKNWTLIDPQYIEKLYISETKKLDDNIDLRNIPIFTGTINDNDLIYIPIGWIHRVETEVRSIGLGSFLKSNEKLESTIKLREFLKKKNIDSIY